METSGRLLRRKTQTRKNQVANPANEEAKSISNIINYSKQTNDEKID